MKRGAVPFETSSLTVRAQQGLIEVCAVFRHHDTRSDTETPKEKLPIGSYRCDIGKTPMVARLPPQEQA
jgi:hypothetical protein